VGAGAAVALAARIRGGQAKEDQSVWVSSAKFWTKSFDVEKGPELAERLSAGA